MSDLFTVDPLLTETATDLFAATCTFDEVQASEAAGWSESVWAPVHEAGFTRIGLPESAGGSGGTLTDAAEVLRVAGAHAAPIPLAETMMLGGWLCVVAGLPLPDGAVSVVPGTANDTLTASLSDSGLKLTGAAHRVPWAAKSDQIAALVADTDTDELFVAMIEPANVTITEATNLAGEPRETIDIDAELTSGFAAVDASLSDQLRLRGALSRTMLMAGALEAMSALTLGYTAERSQFGRPIGRFQAVQQHLVWGAQDAAISKMTAQIASVHAEDGVLEAQFEIASARQVANESAATATRWSHQAHGAMGMTQEYALHHLSRRLWAWRHEYATPGEWARVVGKHAVSVGPQGLYPLVAS